MFFKKQTQKLGNTAEQGSSVHYTRSFQKAEVKPIENELSVYQKKKKKKRRH